MWIEQTALARWVSQSTTVWAYPTILFLHTLALGLVVGVSSVLSLRLVGVASRVPLSPMRRLFPFIWAGFAVSAISGGLLFITDVDGRLANPYFIVKMLFVVLAAISMALLERLVWTNPLLDEQPVSRFGKVLAVVSSVFWVGAITSGRLIAYLTPV